MPDLFLIERRLEIDAAHRATFHGAKCKNLHGHRYTIIVACVGPLIETGPQQGMVLDFSVLKTIMMEEINDPCDHTTLLWVDDPLAARFVDNNERFETDIRPRVAHNGFCRVDDSLTGALYIINGLPTAEILAAHWYSRMRPRIEALEQGRIVLKQVKVFESPQCMAAYPA